MNPVLCMQPPRLYDFDFFFRKTSVATMDRSRSPVSGTVLRGQYASEYGFVDMRRHTAGPVVRGADRSAQPHRATRSARPAWVT